LRKEEALKPLAKLQGSTEEVTIGCGIAMRGGEYRRERERETERGRE